MYTAHLEVMTLLYLIRGIHTRLVRAVYTAVADRPGVHTCTKFSRSKFMYWRMFAYLNLLRSTNKILSTAVYYKYNYL